MDILVNNAAVGPDGPTERTSEADFDAAYAVHAKVPFFPVAELAPAVAQTGEGSIVNIVGQVARFGLAQTALYGPSGVRVNTVSPGFTRTEGTAPLGEALDRLAATIPHGRPGLPEEIAPAVTHLAGDGALFVHGAVLPVDGGRPHAGPTDRSGPPTPRRPRSAAAKPGRRKEHPLPVKGSGYEPTPLADP